MEVEEQRVLVINDASQVGEARRIATRLAERLGFSEGDAAKVAIVVTEAAMNLVKYAQGGEILLRAKRSGTDGVDILALDRGPGLPDLVSCLRDGFSTAGTPGTGLGAIRRLSTAFDVYTHSTGTALMCRVSPGTARTATAGELVVRVGAVSVPKPGEDVCGDGWMAMSSEDRTLLAVIDGLGHGPDAAAATAAALAIVRAHGRAPAPEVVERMHAGLRGTRGAAGAVAALDRQRRVVRFCGIGNIAGLVIADGTTRAMVSHHGILGHEVRKTQEFSYPWPARALVVLHSDGVGTRWDLGAYPGLTERDPLLTAGVLYRDFRRGRDDATVLVARETT
jgi:anti-sigma regulatory factor (Ser/Thr protein kinase)